MKALLVAIFGLTVIDVIGTYVGVKTGHITEANPILAKAFTNNPELVSIFTILFVGCILGLLWNYREKAQHIYLFVTGLLIIKIGVVILHLNWFFKAY